MAIATRLGAVFKNVRKPFAAVGFVIKSTASQLVTAAPELTSGSGAPSDDGQPNGSLYLRTDATDGDDYLYGRIAGAWVSLKGETV